MPDAPDSSNAALGLGGAVHPAAPAIPVARSSAATDVALVATFLGLRYLSNRISLHQQALPSVLSRINTQVRRINQP